MIKGHLDTVPFGEQAEAIKKELNELCRSISPEKRQLIEKKNISFCERRTTTKKKFIKKLIPVSHIKKQQKARE